MTRSHLWPAATGRDMPVDVCQTDEEVVIRASLPGITPEDVDISLSADTVTIGAEHKEEPIAGLDYLQHEIHYGPFKRLVHLPAPVESDHAEASMENGILTVRLPKAATRFKLKARQVL